MIAHLRERTMGRFAAGAARRRHQSRVGGQLVARGESIDRANLGVQKHCTEYPHARNRSQAPRDRVLPRGALHLIVEPPNLFR